MGDIVDWMFESGMMDMPDPFDHGDSEWGGAQPRRSVVCKHCKKAGLRWHQRQHWALIEPNGALHQCRKQTAAEAFSQA